MIPQISKALSSGFTSKQVIDFLLRQFPEHSEKIKAALASGYTADQVLRFLGGGRKALAQDDQPLTEHEKTMGTDIKRRENVNKGALSGATLAATPLVSQAAGAALSRALPAALRPLSDSFASASLPLAQGLPTQQVPESPLLSQEASQKIPESQQSPSLNVNDVTSVTQPPVDTQAQLKSKKINELWEAVNSGKTSRKDPELSMFLKIAKQLNYYRGLNTKERFEQLYNKFEEMQGKGLGLPEMARQLSAANEDIISGGKAKAVEQPSQELDRGQETERPAITKNETVATPHGVGEVREIRNGQAIVDVDGKLHKVKEEELKASPIPEKDLAALYDELIHGIEEETGEDVSRMVQWAGYDPKNNTLTFLPHTGKLYKYGDISPEDAALLTDILSTRKTSGENFIGAWKAGSKSPIGAALSKLIRKLQSERGGKGNEYEETHEPIYSAYEPAIQAKKKKKKK